MLEAGGRKAFRLSLGGKRNPGGFISSLIERKMRNKTAVIHSESEVDAVRCICRELPLRNSRVN